jgi:hypothetical protein
MRSQGRPQRQRKQGRQEGTSSSTVSQPWQPARLRPKALLPQLVLVLCALQVWPGTRSSSRGQKGNAGDNITPGTRSSAHEGTSAGAWLMPGRGYRCERNRHGQPGVWLPGSGHVMRSWAWVPLACPGGGGAPRRTAALIDSRTSSLTSSLLSKADSRPCSTLTGRVSRWLGAWLAGWSRSMLRWASIRSILVCMRRSVWLS